MNKRYAIYARQSIDKPDSISIESQIERCRREIGDAPNIIYSDQGYSGKNTDRPQFQAMLEAVRKGEIQCVVCYKLDRCSRSILDFTQLMDLFQRYNVDFISCTEKFDTTTPVGRAMLSICIVFAQLERETIQQRITDAYHSRCRKGFYMGGRIPIGFSLSPYWLDGKKTSCYVINEPEAQILRRIYDLYQDTTTSLSDVVLALEGEHIRNPRRDDGAWVRPHIGRLIKNPIYVQADERIYHYYRDQDTIMDNPISDYIGRNGCYLYHIDTEQHLVLAPHDGIVSSDIWLRCQKGRKHHEKHARHSTPSSWLIGKLKCQKCGRNSVEKRTIGRNHCKYRYFVCPSSQGKVCNCEGFKPFSAGKVESEISNAIITRIMDTAKRNENICRDTQSSGQIRHSFKRIAATWENASLTPSQLEQILLDLEKQLQDVRTTTLLNLTFDRGKWESISRRIRQWDQLEVDRKHKIADLLIEEINLTDARITVYWRY